MSQSCDLCFLTCPRRSRRQAAPVFMARTIHLIPLCAATLCSLSSADGPPPTAPAKVDSHVGMTSVLPFTVLVDCDSHSSRSDGTRKNGWLGRASTATAGDVSRCSRCRGLKDRRTVRRADFLMVGHGVFEWKMLPGDGDLPTQLIVLGG